MDRRIRCNKCGAIQSLRLILALAC
ncbi:MAG: hypothetical protein JWM11_7899, partial [Planctomycetaceae bacterium]|nr:hypothetical protein [Planctomycetaceae bacterium]